MADEKNTYTITGYGIKCKNCTSEKCEICNEECPETHMETEVFTCTKIEIMEIARQKCIEIKDVDFGSVSVHIGCSLEFVLDFNYITSCEIRVVLGY